MRLDILVAIAFLTTRVSKLTSDDWKKSTTVTTIYLGNDGIKLTLSAEAMSNIKW